MVGFHNVQPTQLNQGLTPLEQAQQAMRDAQARELGIRGLSSDPITANAQIARARIRHNARLVEAKSLGIRHLSKNPFIADSQISHARFKKSMRELEAIRLGIGGQLSSDPKIAERQLSDARVAHRRKEQEAIEIAFLDRQIKRLREENEQQAADRVKRDQQAVQAAEARLKAERLKKAELEKDYLASLRKRDELQSTYLAQLMENQSRLKAVEEKANLALVAQADAQRTDVHRTLLQQAASKSDLQRADARRAQLKDGVAKFDRLSHDERAALVKQAAENAQMQSGGWDKLPIETGMAVEVESNNPTMRAGADGKVEWFNEVRMRAVATGAGATHVSSIPTTLRGEWVHPTLQVVELSMVNSAGRDDPNLRGVARASLTAELSAVQARAQEALRSGDHDGERHLAGRRAELLVALAA